MDEKVTLRGQRMYEFVDRFINLFLWCVAIQKGASTKSISDGRGPTHLNQGTAYFPGNRVR